MDAASSSPSHVPASSREMAPPVFQVMADPSLFRRIGCFQRGISVALRQFWVSLEPTPMKFYGPLSEHLIKLVVKSGLPYHLDLIAASSTHLHDAVRDSPLFSSLPLLAVRSGRADILEWVIAKQVPVGDSRHMWLEVIYRARRPDDLVTLALLQMVWPLTERDAQDFFGETLYEPTAELVQWVTAHYPNVVFQVRLTERAVANQDLALLRCLLEHPNSRGCSASSFDVTFRSKFYDGLECLISNCGEVVTSDIAEDLVRDTAIPIQDIVRRHPAVFTSTVRRVFLDVVRTGDTIQMQVLFATGMIDIDDTISVDDVATWEGLTGLEFLHERGLAIATTEAMDAAAEANRWDIVQFLHHNRTEGCTTRTADAAVKSGDLERVRFLFENRLAGCSVAAMDWAAEHGSMEMLRYLHDHSQIGCTRETMDVAAGQGRLDVVQFLHENQSEGFTTAAIDNAARGGYLKVVKFLCENRAEGCTVLGIKTALDNHHLDIVTVLFQHYPQLFGADLLPDLLLRGAFDVFVRLRDDFPEQARSVVEMVMFEAGKQLELRTIWFILKELERSDLRKLALDGAACLENGDAGLWQRALETLTSSKTPSYMASSSQWWFHPLLWDARTPTWAVRMIFVEWHVDADASGRYSLLSTWAVHAVYHRDIALLQALRDLPPTVIESLSANPYPPYEGFWAFGFEGARATAIRMGDKSILEWLLTNIELPIELTLLSEAVYYHEFEIAEWLVDKYPVACTELDWTEKGSEFRSVHYGLQNGLLDWLESQDRVRQALSFVGIVDFAARTNDVSSLRRLYARYPELFAPRPSLVELSDLEYCREAIRFLVEIGWSADECVDKNANSE